MEKAANPEESAGSTERRREIRLEHKIPLTVTWVDQIGESHEESTLAELVNSYGCRFPLQIPVHEGATVICDNHATGQTRKGRIVWVEEDGENHQKWIGLELSEAGADFWGKEVQEALQTAGLVESEEEEEPAPLPEEIEETRSSMSRRGLLYALMASVLFFFAGGHSAWSFVLQVGAIVKVVLLPLLFFGGLGLSLYASIFYLRHE